jgi:hypothetical protein
VADEQTTLTNIAKDTGELIHQAGAKQRKRLLHTEKYQDAYTAIDKMVNAFWDRLPYIGLALIVFVIFWLLTKLFKVFVNKTLSNRSYTRQNLVLVLHRVGGTFILFLAS